MFLFFLLQNWIMTTLKFFLGRQPLPKNLAIFFLAIFGFACEDQKDHYEESTTLSYYQYSILAGNGNTGCGVLKEGYLKSVHFKKTVAQSSFLSKVL